MIDYIFYLFSFLMVFSGVMVISLSNPVHSVLLLIFTFFNAAGLFILIGAEFIAMTLVIVYVGAVAVLFLFVVMMLNINVAQMKKGFYRYFPLGIALSALIFIEIYLALNASIENMPSSKVNNLEYMNNTASLGKVIYTDYFFSFQLAGLILLVAMIGAIVLAMMHGKDAKRQNIQSQISRRPKDCVTIVKVQSRQGVKV